MENRLEIDDHSVPVNLSRTCEARVTAHIHYMPEWENGDYDYAGTHCTHGVGGTHRVGLELQYAPIGYVDILDYTLICKGVDGEWAEMAHIDCEKLDNGANKAFTTWLELQIKEDGDVQQQAYDDAKVNVPEPDYDC